MTVTVIHSLFLLRKWKLLQNISDVSCRLQDVWYKTPPDGLILLYHKIQHNPKKFFRFAVNRKQSEMGCSEKFMDKGGLSLIHPYGWIFLDDSQNAWKCKEVKDMKKRLLSLFLAWAVCLSMLPAVALAAEDGEDDTTIPPAKVLVNGIELTAGQYLAQNDSTEAATAEDDATLASYVAYYDGSVLHLKNLTLNNTNKKGINWDYYNGGTTHKPVLTIDLEGTNTINSGSVAAIDGSTGGGGTGPSLVIQGNGTLTAKGSYGMWVWHDITIKDSVTVTAEGTNSGIMNNDRDGKIRIEDTATVTAIGGSDGYGIGYDHENANTTVPDIAYTATVTAKGYRAFRQLPTISGGKTYLYMSTLEDAVPTEVDENTDFNTLTASNSATYMKFSPTAPAQKHSHPICGETCTDGGHNAVEWTGVSSLSEITQAGNYYLTEDVTLSSAWKPSDDVNLCLNGKNIIADGDFDAIEVANSKNVTLTDCKQGSITHTSGKKGRGVHVLSGTFNMYGGNITGNTVDGTSLSNSSTNTNAGGGVRVASGTFNMYGGSITNNSATANGGGVDVFNSQKFNMYGGTISGNVSSSYGGGVNNSSPSALKMSGGTITGNVAALGGGGVHLYAPMELSGYVEIYDNYKGTQAENTANDNVYLHTANYKIQIVGELHNTHQIGISNMVTPTVGNEASFATSTDTYTITDSDKDRFTSDVSGYTVVCKNQGLYLAAHNWEYTADEDTATITARCENSLCPANGGRITIAAPTNLVYDGTDKKVATVTENNWQAGEYRVEYNVPSDSNSAGHYTATLRVDGDHDKFVSVGYDVAKATPKFTSWQGYPNGRLFNNQPIENPTSLTIVNENSQEIPFDWKNIQFNWYNAVKNEDNTYTKESKLERNPTDAGDYIIEAVFSETANTNSASYEQKVTIGKAQQANDGVSIQVPLNVYPASAKHTYTVDIAKALENIPHGGSLEPNTSYGGISTQLGLVESTDWDNGKLKVTMQPLANIAGPNLGGITVNLTSKNYNVVPVVVNITLQSKVQKNMQVTMTGWTYGGTPSTPLYEAAAGVKYEITYAKEDGTKLSECPTDAGNYTVTVSYETDTEIYSGTADFTISKATPSYTVPSGLTVTYGQTLANVELTNPEGNTPGTWSWQDADTTSVGDVGSHTFKAKFTPRDSNNYETVSDIDVTVTVGKASGAITTAPTAVANLVYNGQEQVLVNGGNSSTGKVLYRLGDTGDFTEDVPTAVNAGNYTVHYKVLGDANHTDVAGNMVMVTIAKKPITAPAADTTPYIYNGKAQTYKLTADAAYIIKNNTCTDAGTQEVTLTLTDKTNTRWAGDGDDTTDKKYNFVINPATITVTPNALSKTVGANDPTLTYTVSGVQNGETPAFTGALSRQTGENVGTYAIEKGTLALKDNTPFKASNYTLKLSDTPVLFTINARSSSSGGSSSSGSSTPKYTVTLPSKTTGGSVKSSASSAASGSTVTITVTPEDGYKVDKVSVADSKGNELKVTDKGGNKYSFTMPSGKVTVTPTFSKIEQKPENSPFNDVSSADYYYDAVKWASDKGVTGGVSSDLFAPEDGCTRAQIVTFMWRAAGSPEPKALSSFTDVPADAYYAKAVAWAVENGITVGTTDTTFSPDDLCTRAHGVTFLYRAAKATAASGSTAFTDVDENAYYAKPVKWAVDNGITTGVTSELFAPNNRCTRAQIVTFLYRLYGSR